MDIEDDKKLHHIQNFQLQLCLLRDHLIDADMCDVFHVLVPQDVTNHHGIQPVSHDLLLLHVKSNVDVASTSCSWCDTWSQDNYVKEYMKYSFEFVRANAKESLFNKMLETYKQCPAQCQGGPLIACLLLSKILLMTESAIEVMIMQISKIKLREIKGEDVNQVVSMVCSAVDMLDGASDGARCCVSDDFPQTALQVLLLTLSSIRLSVKNSVWHNSKQIEPDNIHEIP